MQIRSINTNSFIKYIIIKTAIAASFLFSLLQCNHKSILETLDSHSEMELREYVLGADRQGYEYIHFPQFCGRSLRVYRRMLQPYDPDTVSNMEPAFILKSIAL